MPTNATNKKGGDATTMTFWETQPNAWKAATHEPRPPQEVMTEFVAWVETFDGTRSFAARPLMFDGMWIEHYLRDFAGRFLLDVPYWGRMVFTGGTLDIGSFISGLFGHTYPHTGDIAFPQSWLGEHEHEHTHRAIDDARGYAVLLSKLLKLARETSAHPDDFIGDRSSLKKRHEKN
ncbi:MAG: DNA polymerase III subunit epsilon [Pseudomonadota bacterium]